MTWTYRKCPCGDRICDKYALSFTGSNGLVDKETADLACAAPDLQEAVDVLVSYIADLNRAGAQELRTLGLRALAKSRGEIKS